MNEITVEKLLAKLNLDAEDILYSPFHDEHKTAEEWAEMLIDEIGEVEAFEVMDEDFIVC